VTTVVEVNPYVWDVVMLAAVVASVVFALCDRMTAAWFAWGVVMGALAVSNVLREGWWGLLWLIPPAAAAMVGRRGSRRRRREFEVLKAQFRDNERRRAAERAERATPNPREEQP
jgi:hypothetical protein